MNDSACVFMHKCENMPDSIRFYELPIDKEAVFSVSHNEDNAYVETTAFYGFKYCPYCGEKVTEQNTISNDGLCRLYEDRYSQGYLSSPAL